MNSVAALIVTHQSAAVVADCIGAARHRCGEVLVIDNASTDHTAEVARAAGAGVVANSRNLGFAAAVNQGVGLISKQFVLLLNPDTTLLDPLEPLLEACGSPETGGATGLLLDASGTPQRGFTLRRLPKASTLAAEVLGVNRLWPGNPLNWSYRCYDKDLTLPGEVEQPPGAFLLFRRSLWEALGGFDEAFWPIWFEDVDFCARARRIGFRFAYVPAVRARHAGAHSIRQLPEGDRQVYWYGSLLRYAAKHFSPVSCRALASAILVGSFPRVAGAVVSDRSLRPAAGWVRVVRMAAGALWYGPRLFRVEGEWRRLAVDSSESSQDN